MDYNYHTHTTRCHHAEGTDEEYIEVAIKAGMTHLGFSDHLPFMFPDGYESFYRVDMARGEEYDSAYGRFFVVTEDTDVSKLKGSYAAFGRITDGMDVIEEIISKVDSNGNLPEVKILSISSHDSH